MVGLLLQELNVSQLGSKHVMTLAPESTLDQAISIMKDFDLFSIPVLDGSEFIGIVDGECIIDEFCRNPYSATLYSKIEDIKFSEVETFDINLSMKDCIEILFSMQRSIPVMENDIIFSVITPKDLVNYNFIWASIDQEVYSSKTKDFDYRLFPHMTISEDSSLLNLINQMSKQHMNYLVLIEPDTKLWKGVISTKEVVTEIFRQTKFSEVNDDFLYRTGLFTLIHHPNLYFSSPPTVRNIRFVMNEHALTVVPLVNLEGRLIDVVSPSDLLRKLLA